MSDKSHNRKLMFRAIILLSCVIAVFAAAYGWFVLSTSDSEYDMNSQTGLVKYELNKSKEEAFYAYFDTETTEDFDDNNVDVDNGKYIRATDLSVFPRDPSAYYILDVYRAIGTYIEGKTYYTDISCQTVVDTTGFTSTTDVSMYYLKGYIHPTGNYDSNKEYFLDNKGLYRLNPSAGVYNIYQGTGISMSYLFSPQNSTDRVLWSSSNSQNITVSNFGRVFAAGSIGESAVITALAQDRNPAGTRVDTSSFIAGVTPVSDYYTAVYSRANGFFVKTQTYFYNNKGSEEVDTSAFVVGSTLVSDYYIFNGLGYIKATGTYDGISKYFYNSKGSPTVDTSNFDSQTDVSGYYIRDMYVKASGFYISGTIYYFPDVSKTITVNIIKKPTDEGKVYNYLPTNTEILRGQLAVNNFSQSNSKLRVKISWGYTDFDNDYGQQNNRDVYLVSDVFANYLGEQIVCNLAISPPLQCSFSKKADGSVIWQNASTNSPIVFVDADGTKWDIDKLSLTPSEYYNLRKYYGLISDENPMPSGFEFRAIMFDKASGYFYYGSNTTAPDYGDVIIPPSDVNHPDTINIIDSIKTTPSYTSFSTRNVFTITLTVQGRQSDYFVLGSEGGKDKWFDVATISTP